RGLIDLAHPADRILVQRDQYGVAAGHNLQERHSKVPGLLDAVGQAPRDVDHARHWRVGAHGSVQHRRAAERAPDQEHAIDALPAQFADEYDDVLALRLRLAVVEDDYSEAGGDQLVRQLQPRAYAAVAFVCDHDAGGAGAEGAEAQGGRPDG